GGGTLQLGSNNSIGVSGQSAVSPNLTMAGGTLLAQGVSDTFGKLRTSAASIVDMTSASEVLEFADSTSLHWVNGTTASGATLHIAHWTGNAVNGGGADQILFPSVDSLTPNQLNQIIFDDSGFTHAKLIAVGSGAELVPTSTAPTGVLTL